MIAQSDSLIIRSVRPRFRPQFRRCVAIALLLLQAVALAVVPSWRAGAAVFDSGADFCTTLPDRGALAPQSPLPAHPPLPDHPTHACGDCCVASAGPRAASDAAGSVAPPSDEHAGAQDARPAIARLGNVLPPACGPPDHS